MAGGNKNLGCMDSSMMCRTLEVSDSNISVVKMLWIVLLLVNISNRQSDSSHNWGLM